MLPTYRPSNRVTRRGVAFLLLAISSGGIVIGVFGYLVDTMAGTCFSCRAGHHRRQYIEPHDHSFSCFATPPR